MIVETFADKVIDFNRHLAYAGELPEGFEVMNPFLDNPETMRVMEEFYHKYYHDSERRRFIIGINPGRNGAGVTGVPFTDTKRLEMACGITMKSAHTHEVSSVFLYDMIEAYGGTVRFYKDFYINSPFPLAIIRQTADGKWLNANYYDDAALFEHVKEFNDRFSKKHIQWDSTLRRFLSSGRRMQIISEIERTGEDVRQADSPGTSPIYSAIPV